MSEPGEFSAAIEELKKVLMAEMVRDLEPIVRWVNDRINWLLDHFKGK